MGRLIWRTLDVKIQNLSCCLASWSSQVRSVQPHWYISGLLVRKIWTCILSVESYIRFSFAILTGNFKVSGKVFGICLWPKNRTHLCILIIFKKIWFFCSGQFIYTLISSWAFFFYFMGKHSSPQLCILFMLYAKVFPLLLFLVSIWYPIPSVSQYALCVFSSPSHSFSISIPEI